MLSNQLSAQNKLLTTVAQQIADHKPLFEGFGKGISDQRVEQQRFKRTLDNQHKLVNNIRNDVHTSNRSLAQSMTAEYRETRDQVLLQRRDQKTTLGDACRTISHLEADVEQSADYIKRLFEGIGKDTKEISDRVEQQRFKRTLDNQQKLFNNIRDAVNINYISLGQSMMIVEHQEIRDQALLQRRGQTTAFGDAHRTINHLQADVEHSDNQVQALMALENSMATLVLFQAQ